MCYHFLVNKAMCDRLNAPVKLLSSIWLITVVTYCGWQCVGHQAGAHVVNIVMTTASTDAVARRPMVVLRWSQVVVVAACIIITFHTNAGMTFENII